ncbi:hypothetical protein [Actinacidiphila glaucinigra]|uniref:hypothetical protein n=1 Tax=Actinacidiphila glaucinigra TaxID=235986 RepID=UPI002E2EDA6D|nr:hypothetical protein [Actinacidiphila glaucinigra]
MLNPVDTSAVIGDGHLVGRVPDQIHPGVAWWVAACFVVTTRTRRLLLAGDGHPVTGSFYRCFAKGAVNASHYACRVLSLGETAEDLYLGALRQLRVPGAWLSTGPDGATVSITLHGADGEPVAAEVWEDIRRLIDLDRVPIPVNATARGTVVPVGPDTVCQEAST